MSKDFSFDSVKNAGLYRYVRNFIVDHGGIDVADILEIHKYLMKKTRYKIMFRLFLKNTYWIIKCLNTSTF